MMTIQQAIELAVQHHQAGRLAEGEQLYRQIISQQPNHPEALQLMGVLAAQAGRYDEAIDLIRRAIQLQPKWPAAYSNLGEALRLQRRLDEAVAAFRQALALDPNLPDVHTNLGNALSEQLKIDEATAAYRKAVALRPNHPESHYTLSQSLLLAGNFSQGWREYEWRWFVKDFPSTRLNFSQPRWDGTHRPDATLLLYNEQGFGDCIQIIRYIPKVAQRFKRVIMWCSPPVHRLFKSVAGVGLCITSNEIPPPFDFHCQLLSLPFLSGTDLATIPNSVPYMSADARDIERWRQRLAKYSGGLKVGLAWAGRPTHSNDRNRSVSLDLLLSQLQIPGVSFFSLQTGEPANQTKNLPPGMNVAAWTEELNDFADTAALIASLDLVISVDTAVAHLAGAMGKPVWTLLSFLPDWRWLLERDDSPWYPTMRIFRQPAIGDWQSVMCQVAQALNDLRKTERISV